MIEVVVASALCLSIVLGIVGAFTITLRSALNTTARIQAAFIAEEGLEAARILRDNGWSANIASQTLGAPLYLSFDGTTWKATTTNAFVDGVFQRTLVLDSVYRDGSKNIVSTGGTLDTNIRKATVSISWREGTATTTHSLATYLTNIFNN